MTYSRTGCRPARDGDRPATITALFRIAAGPRIGYGHLVRARTLIETAGLAAVLSIRGGPEAVRVARRLGQRVVSGTATAVLARVEPDVFVVDDPSAGQTAAWRRAARLHGVPIVSIHDLGLGLGVADLAVDASLGGHDGGGAGRLLAGPRYAVLPRRRRRPSRRASDGVPRVFIALGGGPRTRLAVRLARAVTRAHAEARVTIAAGFAGGRPAGWRDERVVWLDRPAAFHGVLQRAGVAVVAGGVTAYEACSAGIPVVALAVVPAQRLTVRALARAGAVLDGGGGAAGWWTAVRVARVGRLVARLLDRPTLATELAARAARLIDGRGAERVAAALDRLVRTVRPRPSRRERPTR